ncbi:hypothetical protein Zmor_006952 [Zophobas morio]|uniref:Uncharacterized protein n=1 Tax=Zophobas morio TaxID=2755281 RepID=A0AA38IVW7_9CUCU|nr:hypothetical protein Zmor_006952 [Zophobas morio]
MSGRNQKKEEIQLEIVGDTQKLNELTDNNVYFPGREDVKKHFSGQGKNKLSFSELTINKATICTTRKRHKNATTAEI